MMEGGAYRRKVKISKLIGYNVITIEAQKASTKLHRVVEEAKGNDYFERCQKYKRFLQDRREHLNDDRRKEGISESV